MKILMVISETPPIKSGIARVAERLSHGLQQVGHEVDVLSQRDVPRVARGEVRLSSMALRLAHLRQRFSQYDIVHLHGPVPTFSDVFLLAGLRGLDGRRPALVYTHHAPIDLRGLPFGLLAPLYNRLQERLARLADHVVVTTPTYGQRLSAHVPQDRLSVIPWGVDFQRFSAPLSKPEPFTILFLGQIRPYKGLPVLLRAFQGVDEARLWIIGDGHQAQSNRELAQQLGLRNVTFWGQLPDDEMIERLQQAHVLVLPSVTRSEAFGLALLEGMSAGCVPVASHLPGVADVVGNEGFTFPAGDGHALRQLLLRLRDDGALRLHHAKLAQDRARLYPWQRVVFGYERIFEHLCAAESALVVKPALAAHVASPRQPGAVAELIQRADNSLTPIDY